MPGRRKAGLGAGNVEADDPAVAILDGKLGDLARPGGVSHRRDERADPDPVTSLGRVGLAPPETQQGGVDDLLEREPAVGVLFRRPAHLGVDDAVIGEVLGAFLGYSGYSLGGLHDRDGVHERLEVALERTRTGSIPEPAGQLLGIRRRQVPVADAVGELDHRARSDPTVEMVVQEHLGRATKRIRR